MDDSWPALDVEKAYLAALEGRKRRRPSLRARILRKARALALLNQERYDRAMLSDLLHGKLNETHVEYWQPISGRLGLPDQGR